MRFQEPSPGPWMLATSCSWRRIMTTDHKMVCEPIKQHPDGHPDLHFRNGGPDGPDARLIVASRQLFDAARKAHKLLTRVAQRGGRLETDEWADAQGDLFDALFAATGVNPADWPAGF